MASGFTLNWCLRILKNHVAVIVMALIAIGFLLMVVSDAAVIVGIGILIASYFYGIASAIYYDRLSVASTRVALTPHPGMVRLDGLHRQRRRPLHYRRYSQSPRHFHIHHPIVAFKVCMWISFISLAVVVVRKIIVSARRGSHDDKVKAPAQGPVATTARRPTLFLPMCLLKK